MEATAISTMSTHDLIIHEVIHRFLPRFGHGAQVLYVKNRGRKPSVPSQEKLDRLGFTGVVPDLPDIIAHSTSKNWLLLIEAVHTSGPISEVRLLQLQKMVKGCKADVVYVTAFLNRAKFRQYVADIAWETEVWIADNPDHTVHFNGDKFMGPYKVR